MFVHDEDHEKDHYYDMVSTFFSSMIFEFLKSSLTFTSIIEKYHKAIKKVIPKELKELLKEDVNILINSSFQGGYYPSRSSFERIPIELRKEIYSDYFDEDYLPYYNKKFFWRILLEEHVIPFLKDFNEYNYKKILNDILRTVPKSKKKLIMNEYYVKNWALILEVSRDIKTITKEEINKANVLKKNFFNLSPIKKKVIIDIVWDTYFDIDKRYGNSYTKELLSFKDKDNLMELAVYLYLDAYKTVKADFLHYFKGEKALNSSERKSERKQRFNPNECPFCGGLFHKLIMHVRNCEYAPDDGEAQIKDYLGRCK